MRNLSVLITLHLSLRSSITLSWIKRYRDVKIYITYLITKALQFKYTKIACIFFFCNTSMQQKIYLKDHLPYLFLKQTFLYLKIEMAHCILLNIIIKRKWKCLSVTLPIKKISVAEKYKYSSYWCTHMEN